MRVSRLLSRLGLLTSALLFCATPSHAQCQDLVRQLWGVCTDCRSCDRQEPNGWCDCQFLIACGVDDQCEDDFTSGVGCPDNTCGTRAPSLSSGLSTRSSVIPYPRACAMSLPKIAASVPAVATKPRPRQLGRTKAPFHAGPPID